MPVSAGDCFILPDSGGQHPYIVVTEYKGDPPSVVLVNLTSWKPYKDQTVIVDVGEHISVTNRSVVAYDRAEIVKEWNMESLLRLARMLPRASADLLQKIRNGALRSPHIPRKVIDFMES